MEFIREYWWLIIIVAVALLAAVILLRPRQRVRLSDSAPVRPHMAQSVRPEGRGLAGEAAAAAGNKTSADDFCRMKGVGPKFAGALHALGFTRFEQLAHLTPTEIERLDPQLGAFSGRIARDRIVEQAEYLARGDVDGYEQRFGKL
jgi:predicted flap endonuclease-1-like 5' DNA nuclease